MFLKIDPTYFDERANKFFNSMLTDINPYIYKISTSRFVWQDKYYRLVGKVDPNAHVSIYNNGGLVTAVDADGNGDFQTDILLYSNENAITVSTL